MFLSGYSATTSRAANIHCGATNLWRARPGSDSSILLFKLGAANSEVRLSVPHFVPFFVRTCSGGGSKLLDCAGTTALFPAWHDTLRTLASYQVGGSKCERVAEVGRRGREILLSRSFAMFLDLSRSFRTPLPPGEPIPQSAPQFAKLTSLSGNKLEAAVGNAHPKSAVLSPSPQGNPLSPPNSDQTPLSALRIPKWLSTLHS